MIFRARFLPFFRSRARSSRALRALRACSGEPCPSPALATLERIAVGALWHLAFPCSTEPQFAILATDACSLACSQFFRLPRSLGSQDQSPPLACWWFWLCAIIPLPLGASRQHMMPSQSMRTECHRQILGVAPSLEAISSVFVCSFLCSDPCQSRHDHDLSGEATDCSACVTMIIRAVVRCVSGASAERVHVQERSAFERVQSA